MWIRYLFTLWLILGAGVSLVQADGYVETSGSYTEGTPIRGNRYDVNGALKITQATLTSCEDQANNLCMTSGGVVRGTEGNLINSAVGNATSTAFTLPTGWKTLTGRITGAGSVAQVITVYGGTSTSMAAATSDVVCTITLSGTSGAAGTAASCPPFIAPFLYYIAVTSGSSGTPTTILTGMY